MKILSLVCLVTTIEMRHSINIQWRKQWHPTLVLLPGKSHGRRNLVGCSPWGREESGTTERLHFHFSLSCIGEGNGNPLQCSCLEKPRDRGAWWAAIYGVAQGRTRLKWLSCSSSSLFTCWWSAEIFYFFLSQFWWEFVHGFGCTPGVGDGQGGLACCGS